MDDAGIAHTLLSVVYSSVASRTGKYSHSTSSPDRSADIQKLRSFQHSLQHRRILRPVPSHGASGRVYESPKTARVIRIYTGLSGDPATAHTLALPREHLTSSRIYQLVRSQEWCPSYPFT